ncbi:hypothetical protein PBN151_2591 [Paenibacillus sp. NAIST15-1]|nr:hypothetical protein PBN151_2591 [Paenibacillus sp. NAIST15-1]
MDEKGKEVVPSETYELVSKGVSILNLTIVSGESTVDTAKRLVVPNFNYSSNIKSAFSNTYWWGVAITMTESEAKDFAYSLEQIKDGFATEAAVAGIIGGIIGGPAAWAASAAGAIVALGAGLISRSITHYNNSKGVTLNLHWLPITYYEVTKNQ